MALAPKALVEAHTTVRALVERHYPVAEHRVAIDAAAGNGYMSEWLQTRGFDVLPFDLEPRGFSAEGLACAAADLNEHVPAPDEISDLTISIETIEHLEQPFRFMRELARVTKPGGLVIVTTPNVHHVRSRLKALFTGTSTFFEFVEKDPWGQHIMPFSVGQLLYSFDRNELAAVSVQTAGPRRPRLTRGVFAVANGVTTLGALALKTKRRRYPDHFLNRLTRAELFDLGRGEILVVCARKQLRPE